MVNLLARRSAPSLPLRRERCRLDPTGTYCLLRDLDGSEEGIEVVGAVVAEAIDEEGGRAVDAAAHPTHEILAHPALVRPTLHLGDEAVGIEADAGGVLDQVIVAERALMLEKRVVHLPV